MTTERATPTPKKSDNSRTVGQRITAAGWCGRCRKTFAEHLLEALPHNYEPNLSEPIDAAVNHHAALVAALRLPILFYEFPWGVEQLREWQSITGTPEATTKVMCDHIRKALAALDAEETGHE